ncbi:hypothetical protein HEQ69_02185 [Haematospirillum jordaniae]|uniref:MotE family protein n=1 Tax=Haematospirillum jordaniae TaxID=1549855 RepID=UPI0014331D3F|nr:hypothetical protein [Haematospirillum jordaniae]NKD44528.1 hypothetical protein [Haematospirillum jordaniae]
MAGLKTPRIRLLPLVIFVAVLMLSVRLESLWHDIGAGFEQVSQPSRDISLTRMAESPATRAVSVPSPAEEPGIHIGSAVAQTSAPAPSSLSDLEGGGGPSFTRTEVDVLQRLAERRELLDRREKELDTRDGMLKAAEKRIDRKIVELQNLEKTISQLLNRHNEAEKRRIDQLVKIYATMKPKDAAGIFNALEMGILLTIMENMKEAKTAPILAAMEPEKARAVTMEMSRRHQLPVPGKGEPSK